MTEQDLAERINTWNESNTIQPEHISMIIFASLADCEVMKGLNDLIAETRDSAKLLEVDEIHLGKLSQDELIELISGELKKTERWKLVQIFRTIHELHLEGN